MQRFGQRGELPPTAALWHGTQRALVAAHKSGCCLTTCCAVGIAESAAKPRVWRLCGLSSPRPPLSTSHRRRQVAIFSLASIYSGVCFVRWLRSGAQYRQLVLLSGLVCIGSSCGAAGWGAKMQSLYIYYRANPSKTSGTPDQRPIFTDREHHIQMADSDRWLASFYVCPPSPTSHPSPSMR